MPFFKKKREVAEKIFETTEIGAKDIIAPSSIILVSNYLKLGNRLARSFFIFSYPRYFSTAWFSPVINLDTPIDVGFHIHPVETGTILKQLRKKGLILREIGSRPGVSAMTVNRHLRRKQTR